MATDQSLQDSKTVAALAMTIDDAKRNKSSRLDDIFQGKRQIEKLREMDVLFIPIWRLRPFRATMMVSTEWHARCIDGRMTEINIACNMFQGREETMMVTSEAELDDDSVVEPKEIVKSISDKADK